MERPTPIRCGICITAMTKPVFVPLTGYRELPVEEMLIRAAGFREEMTRRRTVRQFSSRPVPREIIEDCLRVAASAPSGANMQPWYFAAVSDPQVKHKIRQAAEQEEHAFYNGRAPQEWLAALQPLGTDEQKPYLDAAPYLIVIFSQTFGITPAGKKFKNYYVAESVGIATGMLIAAIHHAGLVSLTHTPSPMGFLNRLLGRPVQEKPYLILVVGYPAEGASVPVVSKKPVEAIRTFL
jgi:iodotyrosine deiodinase